MQRIIVRLVKTTVLLASLGLGGNAIASEQQECEPGQLLNDRQECVFINYAGGGYTVSEPGTVDRRTTVETPRGNGATPVVSASTSIQGCNAGLVLKAGVYTCRSNLVIDKEIVISTPTATGCVTGREPECFAIVPTGAPSSSGFDASRAGRVQYGYLGTDGNLYTSPDEDSASICTGTCQQLNTTYALDNQRAEQAAAAARAEQARLDAIAAASYSSGSSSGYDTTSYGSFSAYSNSSGNGYGSSNPGGGY